MAATYLHPGYWKCDPITGKRLKWIEPYEVPLIKKQHKGSGGGGALDMDLVLVNSLNLKKRIL